MAEVLVELAQGPGQRGSGYRVSDCVVLTAAHVVRDAARVRVRFDADSPDEWVTEATGWSAEPGGDVAALTIAPPSGRRGVEPARFGRVGERDAVLSYSAVGFPRFKLRSDPAPAGDDGSPSQYRDAAHVVGPIAVLSNRREGTLELAVAPPESDPDPAQSPWAGMSGAAVWSAGRIIGLVSEHHRSDGLNRLAAVRVDRWYTQLGGDRLARLGESIGLPARLSDLVDVVPTSSADALAADYFAQVEDIAPLQLLGRDEELAALTRFCAGEEAYQWWRGRPWAGKTALATWAVLHPPAGVTAVSFFVTGRLAGQADSTAFTEALIQQLALVAGEPATPEATPMARDGQRRRLLKQAAARVAETGGRLLLVVDGLDEDRGVPPAGSSSIAALLPARPPENLRILVTSRTHPGLPADLPAGHPLRTCVVRELTPSPFAHELEIAAKAELVEHLHGPDQLTVDIVGYITAAGGGLTLRELCELTDASQPQVEGRLGGVFGRTLYTRSPTDAPHQPDRVHLFAHETLREIAEQQLAYDLDRYRQRIHNWADEYRVRGWPADTPRYLLRPYGRLLADLGDLDRFVTIATDVARHDRMLDYTQGDTAALTEVVTAQQLLLEQDQPRLADIAVLAVHRDRLVARNTAMPQRLPGIWVQLGQSQRALALARSLPKMDRQAEALSVVAHALARAGQLERAADVAMEAERVARRVADPDLQAEALVAVVHALAEAGRVDEAERVARGVADPYSGAEAWAVVAEAWAVAGRVERAVEAAAEAERVARGVADPGSKAWALAGVVVHALAGAGQLERAVEAAVAAEQAGCIVADPELQASALAVVAVAFAWAGAGRVDEAERVARGVADPKLQATALAVVAEAWAGAGQLERAAEVVVEAERVARHDADTERQVQVLVALTQAMVETGQLERAADVTVEAERVARSVADQKLQAEALVTVAAALAGAGRVDEAERVARSVPDPWQQAKALVAVAAALAGAGRVDEAERVARGLNRWNQAEALVAVVRALAGGGRVDEAERVARSVPDPWQQAKALVAVVRALAGGGRVDEAERVARSVADDPEWQAEALIVVAKSATESPDPARAIRSIAIALTGTAWLKALPALAVLAPNAVEQIGKAAAAR